MYNTDNIQENNTISNNDLRSAFQTIHYIILQKDDMIKQLEEENHLLKIKLKEYETKKQNRDLSNKDNVKIQTHDVEQNTQRENRQRIITKSPNNYGMKIQQEREDFIASSASPFRNSKIQQDIQINNNIKNHFVPVYSNDNLENNYLFTPTAKFETNKSPPNMNIIMEDSNQSRNEVKVFLNEVREKIPSKDFKEFIQLIKILTDKNSQEGTNRKEIFDKVKILFGIQYRDMYLKFEHLLSLKK